MSNTSHGQNAKGTSREPTMADVADHLGVSRQLVSLVLRDQPGPSARTRERVLKAADDLGYRPHLGAQFLRQSRSTRIGVGFIPSNFNESEIVEAMYSAARDAGFSLVLSAQGIHRGTDRVLRELKGHRCGATILIGSTVGEDELQALIRKTAGPVAVIGHGELNKDFDVVRSAGDAGIELCVDHLFELGHRRIAYIDVPSIAPAPLRQSGYEKACERHGIEPWVLSRPMGLPEEEGAAAARAILDSRSHPTAVVCANDQSALGAAMVFLEGGLNVPRDISITGFDDSRIASWSFMDLTTAQQDPAEMGEFAVAAVLARMDEPRAAPAEYVLQPRLVVRGSTAPPA